MKSFVWTLKAEAAPFLCMEWSCERRQTNVVELLEYLEMSGSNTQVCLILSVGFETAENRQEFVLRWEEVFHASRIMLRTKLLLSAPT